jgi:hypothetical protein
VAINYFSFIGEKGVLARIVASDLASGGTATGTVYSTKDLYYPTYRIGSQDEIYLLFLGT